MLLTKTHETFGDVYFETLASKKEFVGRIEELIANRKAENRSPFYYFKNPAKLVTEVNYYEFRVSENYIYKTTGINSPRLYIYTQTNNTKTTVQFHLSYTRYLYWSLLLVAIYFGYSIYDSRNDQTSLLATIVLGVITCLIIWALAWSVDRYNSFKFKRFVNLLLKDIG